MKDGAVLLAWTGPAASPALLLRSTSDLSLGVQPVKYPITLVDLRAASYKDARVADGVRYYYQVRSDERWSNVLAVDVAPRALAVSGTPSLRVDKRFYVLEVWDGDHVVKRYPIALGRNPVRRKLHQDNASTPEGAYRIVHRQPEATFYKAYDLNYPNDTDVQRYDAALAAGQLGAEPPSIGGEIQIHGQGIGSNWTYGCIALRNADMDELFACPAIAAGTPVYIFGGELAESAVVRLVVR
jgi:murein L,D-transpeptidase YafK